MVTDPPTHKQTGPITIHCAAASAQCDYKVDSEKKNLVSIVILARTDETLFLKADTAPIISTATAMSYKRESSKNSARGESN